MKCKGTIIIATELKNGKKKQLNGIAIFSQDKKEVKKIKDKLRQRYKRTGKI